MSVEACRKPTGVPYGENKVMAPVGLMTGFSSWSGRGGVDEVEDRVMTFMPVPSELDEGMNRVVAPVAAEFTEVRCG